VEESPGVYTRFAKGTQAVITDLRDDCRDSIPKTEAEPANAQVKK
jgi:hypothetical protein